MTYATQQNLLDRYGEQELIELTDRANLGVIDAAVLAQALADADAEINGYLAGRYALPLATTPVVLVRAACDIARFNLHKDAAPELVQKRRDDAVKFLALVGQGKIGLGLDAAAETAPATGGPQHAGGARVFDRGSLQDY